MVTFPWYSTELSAIISRRPPKVHRLWEYSCSPLMSPRSWIQSGRVAPSPTPTGSGNGAHLGATWSAFLPICLRTCGFRKLKSLPQWVVVFWESGGPQIHRSRFVEFGGSTGLRLLTHLWNTFWDPVPQGCLWRYLDSFSLPFWFKLNNLDTFWAPCCYQNPSLSAKQSFFFVLFKGSAAWGAACIIFERSAIMIIRKVSNCNSIIISREFSKSSFLKGRQFYFPKCWQLQFSKMSAIVTSRSNIN